MRKIPLAIEVFDAPRAPQSIEDIEVSGKELLSILSMFEPYGLWRLDLDTGQTFWTRDVFEIHGLKHAGGPVNLVDAMNVYHPEDRRTFAELINEAIQNKTGFRATLRLGASQENQRTLVKLVCKYRINDRKHEELIGVFSQVGLPIGSVATTQ